MLRPLLIGIAAVALLAPRRLQRRHGGARDSRRSPPRSDLQTFTGDGAGILSAVAPTTVPGAPPVTTVSGNDDRWHNTAVTLHLHVTDGAAGVAYTTYQVGNGAWEKGTTIKVAAPKDHSSDGAVKVALLLRRRRRRRRARRRPSR